ncbi:MAG: hypothetical protein NTV94_11195, partial [Planctomycetota bacterium]|nr:hypothetical protein [Planctomycetota bacterium]
MLPPLSAYHNAIASPRQAFVDPELRLAKPAALRMGLPVAMVGGFAATYRLVTPSGDVAVRCFHRESPDLSARYNHISKALATSPSPHMVKFDFQPRGIMVEGQAYPIVRMEWAKGKVLSSVLREQHGNREVLAALIRQLNRVEQSLRSLGISHGDLQPENIIWDGTSLRLLDYDGMFVPGMTPGRSAELGQRHFQHPGRSAGTFGPDMDRFSFITLALSLRALMARSSLYNEYAVTDENILFQASDYKDPSQSRAFMELLHIAEIRE